MIKIRNLTKRYKSKLALNNVNLDLNPGEIIGLVGPNGAGKSTLLKCMSKVIINYDGDIKIDGNNEVGLVLDDLRAYPNKTLEYNLKCFQLMRGLNNVDHSMNILDKLNFDTSLSMMNTRLKKFSYGMNQKIIVALSLMSNPNIVLLDEPFRGLDVQSIDNFRELLHDFKSSNRVVMFSSHDLSDIENICDRVIVINKGQILDIIDARVVGDSVNIKIVTSNNEKTMEILSEYNPTETLNTISLDLKDKSWNEVLKTLIENDIEVLKVDNFSALKDRVIKVLEGRHV